MTQPEINPPATAIATIEIVSPTTGQSVTIPVPVFEMIAAELAELAYEADDDEKQ
jgi:hypothetical protein